MRMLQSCVDHASRFYWVYGTKWTPSGGSNLHTQRHRTVSDASTSRKNHCPHFVDSSRHICSGSLPDYLLDINWLSPV